MRILAFSLALLVPLVGCGEPAVMTSTAEAAGAAKIGQPAPAFELVDTDGKSHSLAAYKGKIVVIEWFNPGCPYVVYAHGSTGPLKDQPAKWTKEGVVWLAINSGAAGKQGNGLETNQKARTEYGMSYPVLLDEQGAVGRLYDAKNTPGMYIVDRDGTLVYAGALDTAPRGEDDGGHTNWVDKALGDLAAGKPVATAQTKAYGCSVKYN